MENSLEVGMRCIKYMLLCVTAIFVLIACLMIVIGISVYSYYHDFADFFEGAKRGSFFTPSILSVLLGLVLIVLTSFGFFGSLKQSTCMVNLYALFLTFMLIAKLVVVILAFTTDGARVMKYIEVPVWEYSNDPEIQDDIDRLQYSLNCCGSDSFLDYVGVDFTSNNSSTVAVSKEIDGSSVTVVLPGSCCITSEDQWCTRLRPVGCKEALVHMIVQNASVIGVLGVSVMFIELLGVVFALLLARCIRKLKSERALMAWKVKEQMILARQAKENRIYIDQPDSSVA